MKEVTGTSKISAYIGEVHIDYFGVTVIQILISTWKPITEPQSETPTLLNYFSSQSLCMCTYMKTKSLKKFRLCLGEELPSHKIEIKFVTNRS